MLKNEPDMYIIRILTVISLNYVQQSAVKKSCSGHQLSARAPCLSPAQLRFQEKTAASRGRNAAERARQYMESSGIQPFLQAGPERNWWHVFRGYPMKYAGLHVQEPTHLLIVPTSGIIIPYVFSRAARRRCSPSCWRGSHGSLGMEGSEVRAGPRVNVWRTKQAAPILFKLDGFGTKSVNFSIFTAVNNSFCRTCCWLMCSPFVLGEFPLIIRCFQWIRRCLADDGCL